MTRRLIEQCKKIYIKQYHKPHKLSWKIIFNCGHKTSMCYLHHHFKRKRQPWARKQSKKGKTKATSMWFNHVHFERNKEKKEGYICLLNNSATTGPPKVNVMQPMLQKCVTLMVHVC